jgi:hypothetical protein
MHLYDTQFYLSLSNKTLVVIVVDIIIVVDDDDYIVLS